MFKLFTNTFCEVLVAKSIVLYAEYFVDNCLSQSCFTFFLTLNCLSLFDLLFLRTPLESSDFLIKKYRVTVYVFLKFMMEILKINIFNMIVMFLDEHSVWNIERHFLQYFSICGDHRNQENIIICSRPEYITDILFSFDLFAITIQTWTSFSLIIPILQKRVLNVCRC